MSKLPKFPGSRWWKVDFHTHTPASLDTTAWQRAKGSVDEVTPEKWLAKYMEAEVDCVVVTDHNSGAWIDELKRAYVEKRDNFDPDFRELVIFPGVELTVNGGFHVLAVFDPTKGKAEIDRLIGCVGYQGTPGDSNGCSRESLVNVIEAIVQQGAIAIPAHVDDAKGLLQLENGQSKKAKYDATTLRQVFDSRAVYAIEVVDGNWTKPEVYAQARTGWTEVLGSDSHSFQGSKVPGSRFTWVKMEECNLEGLRLALLDGNGHSTIRSDDPRLGRHPNELPANWIVSIEVDKARYMGRGSAECVTLNPRMNAVIGGRGTGKSTIVHFLRSTLERENELQALDKDSEPRETFDRFGQIAAGRDSVGALTDDTRTRVEFEREGQRFRVTWGPKQPRLVEEATPEGQWLKASSQEVRDRFPIRIFSQGQVLALAVQGNTGVLDIIDEQALEVRQLRDEYKLLRSKYFASMAKVRELQQRLRGRDKVSGLLDDVNRKLARFEVTQHAAILKEHQKRTRQLRELARQEAIIDKNVEAIAGLCATEGNPDLPVDLFVEGDSADQATILAFRRMTGQVSRVLAFLEVAQRHLLRTKAEFHAATADGKLGSAATTARAAYDGLVSQLRAEGVQDPKEYDALVQERQRLETDLAHLMETAILLKSENDKASETLKALAVCVGKVNVARTQFLQTRLHGNLFVRMSIDRFGRDPRVAEASFRSLIDKNDGRLAAEILAEDGKGGLIYELYRDLPDGDEVANAAAISQRLLAIKAELEKACTGQPSNCGVRLAKYLKAEFDKKPELLDRIHVWEPRDALRIEYSPSGDGKDYRPIEQGSQGQRAAAMLAFFLAFGTEPLVLDQPEDDLDNHLIYNLVVRQLRFHKRNRQVIVITHNANVVVNGNAELVHALDFAGGACRVISSGSLQKERMRGEVCQVMEGGREALDRRYRRLAEGDSNA
jgi:energy-coupling factor transporter ATP-binding protein EcfA2